MRRSPQSTPLFALLILALPCAGAGAQTVFQTFPILHQNDKAHLIGDVDGDGIRDLAFLRWLFPAGNRIDVYSTRSGLLLHQFVPPPPQNYTEIFRVGDVDGDGRDDIAYLELHPQVALTAVIRSGQTGAYLLQFPGPGLSLEGIDDVNGDGRSEIVVSDSQAVVSGMIDAGRVEIVDGATGAVLWAHTGTAPGALLYCRSAIGDVDGDGKRDYVLATQTRFWGYSGANGTQIFTFPRLSQTYGNVLRDIGDFNADGFDDIAMSDYGSWPFYSYDRRFVLAGPSMTQVLWDNVNVYGTPSPYAYGDPVGRLGDLDGDGFDDFGVGGGLIGTASTVHSGRDHSVLASWPTAGQRGLSSFDSPGDIDGDGYPEYWFHTPLPIATTLQLVSGAPPGVTTIGGGCVGPGGFVPTIGVGIGARLGRTMTVNLSNASPNLLQAILGAGTSNQQWSGTPLPFDLGFLGMPGCAWYIAADTTMLLPTTSQSGLPHHAQQAIPVPQATALLGSVLHWQWFVLEPTASGLGGSVTRAVRTVVVP